MKFTILRKSVASSFLILALTSFQSYAQRFNSVVFSKLPQDLQLYPRNEQNEAVVPISGILEVAGYDYMSVQVLRNNVLHQYLKSPIQYNSKGIGSFSAEAKIKAELADYSFKVYFRNATDSTLVVERQNVVSGDVYVVSGQSNSTAFFAEPDTSRYCRTFGKITQNLNTDPYNPADTLWAFSNLKMYDNGVGTMGFAIQEQLVQQSGVPNCLINAGFHWSSASGHAQRTESNPADLNNGYGRMLYRLQKAGIAGAVKAYIFRQGETEAYHEGGNWPGNFDLLRKYLKMDLPKLEKIYVFQIDVIYYPSPIGALVRDYQRRLPDIYPDLRSLATVGTKDFDGLHYGRAGYVQNGLEVSRLIARDFYALKNTANIDSPNIKKVYYKDAERKQVVLVFDEGQELIYPEPYQANNNVTLDLKDFIYFNGQSGSVASGKADGNRIILELRAPQNGNTLDLMPMFTPVDGPFYPLDGPFIKNKLGMRAFTFFEVPIGQSLAVPKLTAKLDASGAVSLSWDQIAGASQYALEKKLSDENAYRTIAMLDSTKLTFTDKDNSKSEKLSFRLRALNRTSESADYSYAEIEMPVITGVEKDEKEMFTVFPNPVQKGQTLTIQMKQPMAGALSLINSSGETIDTKQVSHQKDASMQIPQSAAGYHFIKLQSGDKSWSVKVLVR
ncbi:T9SS type A sorting domain-containing protein [Dyadobacter sp. CY326]|uniref:T9SS type A sorting domain-containing protein n=1 Tax=Dyadobacter sp. CY326 TaxID=2907300 RepID=UPI001F3ADA2D|nr:T9SS type A sorting domain-containing protein [Dyadobacter sp. CY326]MCE7066053.1 T9SS type A sorting domain-containing protein [Dyadobacter sp. CY326]